MKPEEQLALEFARSLRAQFEPEIMDEIVRLNATPEYVGCCATGDFCDSNMNMLEAWEVVFGRAPFNEGDVDVMNDAWDIAKASGFKI